MEICFGLVSLWLQFYAPGYFFIQRVSYADAAITLFGENQFKRDPEGPALVTPERFI